jgi:hypothetical protein
MFLKKTARRHNNDLTFINKESHIMKIRNEAQKRIATTHPPI